jgi:hypothetical protein
MTALKSCNLSEDQIFRVWVSRDPGVPVGVGIVPMALIYCCATNKIENVCEFNWIYLDCV